MGVCIEESSVKVLIHTYAHPRQLLGQVRRGAGTCDDPCK